MGYLVAEVRWTGFGEITTDAGHKILHYGEDSKHQYGITFIVQKKVVDSIVSCTPISSRLISIRISVRPYNITVIQVHAPASDHEQFYEQLDSIKAKTPKKDIFVVQGDWNAEVGPDAYQHWAGRKDWHWKEKRQRMKTLRVRKEPPTFPCQHSLTLTLSRTATWYAPNGQVNNQINFILTPQHFKSCINKANTRSLPGADIGSDHDLVLQPSS